MRKTFCCKRYRRYPASVSWASEVEQQPAVRVQVDPQALAARGINLEDVRTVLGQANVDLPKGTLNSPRQTYTLNTNDQLLRARQIRQPDHRLS